MLTPGVSRVSNILLHCLWKVQRQYQTCPPGSDLSKDAGNRRCCGNRPISLDGMADDMSLLRPGRQHFLWPQGLHHTCQMPILNFPEHTITQNYMAPWPNLSPLSPRVVSKSGLNTSLDCDREGKPVGRMASHVIKRQTMS